MKVKAKHFLLFCAVILSDSAFAENGCPDGMTPFQNGSDPAPKCYSIQGDSAPAQPRGRWETRWGAIAIGSTATGGGVGVARDMSTKRQAEKTAVSQCMATGGGALCKKYVLRYYNQCAVIAWGDTSPVMQGAETIEIASQIAMEKCKARTKNCKIWYSDCSPPVWVE
jgi:Domain of unknown function (DUF4189)